MTTTNRWTNPCLVLAALTALAAAWLGPAGGSRAHAQSAPSAPRRAIDETELYVRLFNPDPEGGYEVMVDAIVYGVTSGEDAIRVDVEQGTRTLVSTRCRFDERDGDAGRLSCRTDEGHRLTATGAVTVELVYLDDVAETSTTLRTLHLNVRSYPYWVRDDDRGRHVMGAMYQLDGSDLLGTAFAWMEHPYLVQSDTNASQRVSFYTGFSGTYAGLDGVLRCRVGDVRVPDLEISTRDYADFGADERLSPTSDIRHVGWYRSRFQIEHLWWGRRLPMPASGSGYDPTNLVFLGEHPGTWSCDVRSNGAVVRTFRFEVDADGRIVAHAIEAAQGAPAMIGGLHLVDVRIPSPSPRDVAVDPAAIRAGWQYGTPWLVPASVAEMLGALPPVQGSSAPTARGRGASGRRPR